ncbi:MAG: hybrid sensor histidine kinase/response regulator [Methylotetracoccus sp.]
MNEFSLLDLFREEAESHTAALTDGLIALESSAGADSQSIEPLMRAAHSLKGAARVVGLDAVVTVAHAMEELLVAVQSGLATLSANRVDQLLRCIDWIRALSDVADAALPGWLDQQGATADTLARELESGEPSHQDPPTQSAPDGSPGESGATTGADSAPMRTGRDPADGITDSEQTPPAQGVSEPVHNDRTASDRAVKVNAEVVTRFIGLASEALVEAHRLDGLNAQLQALRERHGLLASALRYLQTELIAERSSATLLDKLDSARQALDDARGTLSSAMQDFDGFARRSTQIAEKLFGDAIASRQRPFEDGLGGFPRLVRELARQLGKQVRFEISGQATLVDRDVLEKLEAPLRHLLQNAVDHGLESPEERTASGKNATGSLRLDARHRGGALVIGVSDDGKGIARERLRRRIVERGLTDTQTASGLSASELFDFLFLPGVTTRDNIDEISGRGVGLDVVQSMVQAEGGSLAVESEEGRGTRFTIRLPVTRSVVRALLASIGGEPYAFPLAQVERVVRLPADAIRMIEGRSYVNLDEHKAALVSAAEILELDDRPTPEQVINAVVIGHGDELYAIEVDALLGERELVVRPIDPRFGHIPHISAASIDDDGVPLLILDSDDLVRSVNALVSGGRPIGRRAKADAAVRQARRILIVDDSITVRELERRLLQQHGYAVDVAVDGVEGWNALRLGRYDLVVSDIDMPRMNGIDLVRQIRRDPSMKELPVMIVSYKDREEDRLRGLEAGADYYFAKSSFRDDALLDAVRDLIGTALR